MLADRDWVFHFAAMNQDTVQLTTTLAGSTIAINLGNQGIMLSMHLDLSLQDTMWPRLREAAMAMWPKLNMPPMAGLN